MNLCKCSFTTCIILIIFINFDLNSQALTWVKQVGGSGNNFGTSLTLDTDGNPISIGYFSNTISYSLGGITSQLTSNGGSDIVICKNNQFGDFLWVKQFGGVGNDRGLSITTDAEGHIIATGAFRDLVDFNPSVEGFILTSNGNQDIFILKLDASGNFVWAKSIGGSGNDVSESVAVDSLGNIYVTGFFETTVDFDPGTQEFNLTSSGGRDVFLCKLDKFGNFIWANSFGGFNDDSCFSVAINNSNEILITGSFGGTVDFDPGIGIFTLTAAGNLDVFISKFDIEGNFIWARQFGGTGGDSGHSLTFDNLDNIYATGVFSNTVEYSTSEGVNNLNSEGGFDVFVLKMDSLGNFLWANQFGGISNDLSYSISFDQNTLFVAGTFQGTAIFNQNLNSTNLISIGSYDIFLFSLDISGGVNWAINMGGSGIDVTNSIAIYNGRIYSTGYFFQTAVFGSIDFTLTSQGNSDMFIYSVESSSLGLNKGNENNIIVYPNPTNGILNISSSYYGQSYSILDTTGKSIVNGVFDDDFNVIDIHFLKQGLYFLCIEGHVFKIVKQ